MPGYLQTAGYMSDQRHSLLTESGEILCDRRESMLNRSSLSLWFYSEIKCTWKWNMTDVISKSCYHTWGLNTMRLRQNGRHFTDDTFKCFFWNNKANLRDLIAATGLVILLKLDLNRRFFSPCDLDIWWMTPNNNRAPLLCYFKLFASFRNHWWIQTEVTVRKRLIWVKIDTFFSRVTL